MTLQLGRFLHRAGLYAAAIAFGLGVSVTAVVAGEGDELDLLTSDIWTDVNTGVAIAGQDAVSYFTPSGPVSGNPQNELVWGGAAWWFQNEGNMAAFRDAPWVYAPRFGGHAVLALARRGVVPGRIDVWEIWNGQLYFFASPVNLAIWRRERLAITERAISVWQERLDARRPALVVVDVEEE